MRAPRIALVVLCAAQFVDVLDVNAVLVALPSLGRDLHLAGGALQWVITAYVLVFGACLLPAGRLADALGRRRVFVTGMVLFTGASAACGAAPDAAVLVAARALQGLGAALTAPAALAMIVDAFPAGRPRERAVAVWTAVAALGGAAGVVFGGLIAGTLGWRWIFAINVPIGLATLALAPRVLPAGEAAPVGRAAAAGRGASRVLPAGEAAPVGRAAAAGRGAPRVLPAGEAAPVGRAAAAGRGAPRVLPAGEAAPVGRAAAAGRAAAPGAARLGRAAAAAPGAGLRLLGAVRAAAWPVVPAGVLRRRPVLVATGVAVALTATTSGGAVLATLQLQDVLGLSPRGASLALLPLSLAVIAGSVLAARVRAPARAVIAGGLLLVGAGSLTAAAGLSEAAIVGWAVLAGLGLGAASVAATTLGASAVPEAERGSASALLNAAAQIGTALGVPALVLLAGATSAAIGFAAAAALTACAAAMTSRAAGRVVSV